MRPIVVWFRRDLRVLDHPALYHASRTGVPIIPLFIFDTDIIREIPSDGAVFDFQAEALAGLRESISSLGGTLILRRGTARNVHRQIIAETAPQALYFNRDYHPRALDRDNEISGIWLKAGLEVRSFPDVVQHEPEELRTREGKPYVVFTPYARAWKQLPHSGPCGKSRRFQTPELDPGTILWASDLKKRVTIRNPGFKGGEATALARWKTFLREKVDDYEQSRNVPGSDGTSRLSPYLRFGCIAGSRLIHDLERAVRKARGQSRTGIGKYLDELIWRDFYISVLYHFPRLLGGNYRQEFDHLPWKFDEKMFRRWSSGETGFPLVDAGMRQLNETGWMHNRVRMVVASFLTKDLMQDWRLGERVFEEQLMDIETASNNGGWQWAASTGVDPRPLRIFNPELQARKYDPDGSYIRTWVPELRSVPTKFIHRPDEMPDVLQKEVGCVIGRNYMKPIVNHKVAATRFKTAFMLVKSKSKPSS